MFLSTYFYICKYELQNLNGNFEMRNVASVINYAE